MSPNRSESTFSNVAGTLAIVCTTGPFHPLDEDWLGKEIPCPNCKGTLKVNDFVVGERSA